MSTGFVTTQALPDVPGDTRPVQWRTVLLELGKSYSFSCSAIPSAARLEMQDRIDAAITAIHNHVEGNPTTAVWNEVRALPDDPALAAHPSNALAILAAILDRGPTFAYADPEWLFSGSFATDGDVLPVQNPVTLALKAKSLDTTLVLNRQSAEIAKSVWAKVKGVSNAAEVWDLLHGYRPWAFDVAPRQLEHVQLSKAMDLKHVIGQTDAKQALEIAVAGGHSALFMGPPGAGKSLLASCIPGIAPPLNEREMLEVAAIWQSAGKLGADQLPCERPLRSVDSNITKPALLGGGSDVFYPGEVSLAHGGYLYIDEVLQMTRASLEALRSPMQDGRVQISRVGWKMELPSRFQLIGASNPCPCGYWDADAPDACTCKTAVRETYQAKLSGPMAERLHIHVKIKQPDAVDVFMGDASGEDSATVAERVAVAAQMQMSRQGKLNAALTAEDLNELRGRISEHALKALRGSGLSLRGLTNVLKLAQTMSDLQGDGAIRAEYVNRARSLSQKVE